MKLQIVDWSDDVYDRTRKATGNGSSEVVAEFEIESFKGFSYDGGRLDITGHPETIWMSSNQFSINVVEDKQNN